MKKSTRFLASFLAFSSVLTPVVASAGSLHVDGPISKYKLGFYDETAEAWDWSDTSEHLDRFGEFTIDGNLVWCIEPSVYTDEGFNYSSDGDPIQSGATVRTPGGSVKRSGIMFKIASFIIWATYKASEKDISELKKYVSDNNIDSSGIFNSEIDFLRSGDGNTKWTSVQLLIWLYATHVITYDHDGLSESARIAANHYNKNDSLAIARSYNAVMDHLLKKNYITYNGGFNILSTSDLNKSGQPGQRMIGSGGEFTLNLPTKVPIKVRKEFANISSGISNKPNFNPSGIKVGVYKDVNATTKVGELIIGPNGESNTIEVEEGTYYGFELDVNGQPIKTGAQEVVSGNDVTRSYVSGKDSSSQNKYVTWQARSGGSKQPLVSTFENMPEIVNFTFHKEIKDPKVAALQDISNQYTRKGAEYTLYSDANATQAVTKNGQPVVAVVDENGLGRFDGLYRGRYWVKETKVPTDKFGKIRYKLDETIHPVDLSSGDEGETTVTNSTPTITKSFTFLNKFESLELTKPPKSSLIIKKKDAETKTSTAQGQATLAGGEFKVEFFESKSLGQGETPKKLFEAVYRTDDNGEIDVRKRSQKVSSTDDDKMDLMFTAYEGASQEWGVYNYRVTEIKAPNGYKLSDTEKQPKNFVVKDDQTNFTWIYDDASFYNKDLELHLVKSQRASGDWLPQVEADKALIAQANFELTNKQTNQKFTATTDNQGRLKFDGVIAGDYSLREISVNRYLTNGQVVDLTVSQQDGTTKLTASSTSTPTDTNGPYTVTTTNDGDIQIKYTNTTKPFKSKLIKANEKGSKLEGAKFKLVHYGEDGTTKIDEKELTTNTSGELEFTEMIIGHWYTLEETQAPEGYKLPAIRKMVRFRAESVPVKNLYAVSYQIANLDKANENNVTPTIGNIKKLTSEGKMVDGIKFDADENEGTMALEFDVVNNTWQKLPATGSMFGAIAVSAALIVVFGSVVFYVKKREE